VFLQPNCLVMRESQSDELCGLRPIVVQLAMFICL
jgi:hypothetical protein